MDFQEIKHRFESGLALELGAEHPFQVVQDEAWSGPCPDGAHLAHQEDIPRACLDCHRVHIPASLYGEFTVARIDASVEIIAEQFHSS